MNKKYILLLNTGLLLSSYLCYAPNKGGSSHSSGSSSISSSVPAQQQGQYPAQQGAYPAQQQYPAQPYPAAQPQYPAQQGYPQYPAGQQAAGYPGQPYPPAQPQYPAGQQAVVYQPAQQGGQIANPFQGMSREQLCNSPMPMDVNNSLLFFNALKKFAEKDRNDALVQKFNSIINNLTVYGSSFLLTITYVKSLQDEVLRGTTVNMTLEQVRAIDLKYQSEQYKILKRNGTSASELAKFQAFESKIAHSGSFAELTEATRNSESYFKKLMGEGTSVGKVLNSKSKSSSNQNSTSNYKEKEYNKSNDNDDDSDSEGSNKNSPKKINKAYVKKATLAAYKKILQTNPTGNTSQLETAVKENNIEFALTHFIFYVSDANPGYTFSEVNGITYIKASGQTLLSLLDPKAFTGFIYNSDKKGFAKDLEKIVVDAVKEGKINFPVAILDDSSKRRPAKPGPLNLSASSVFNGVVSRNLGDKNLDSMEKIVSTYPEVKKMINVPENNKN